MEKDQRHQIDQWIDRFGDVQRLTPTPFLLTRIRQNIENRKTRQAKEEKLVFIFAALMAIFISLNIFSWTRLNKTEGALASIHKTGAEALAQAYDLKITDYSTALYEKQ